MSRRSRPPKAAPQDLGLTTQSMSGARFINPDGSFNVIRRGLPRWRTSVHFFPLSWTIVHPIDERSPLFGITEATLAERDPEFFILIKGFDDVFSQVVHSRFSYKAQEIVWGARFVKIFKQDGSHVAIDLDRLGEHEPAILVSSLESRRSALLQAEAEAALQSTADTSTEKTA